MRLGKDPQPNAVEASAACRRPLRAEDPMPRKAVEAAAIAPEPPAAAPKLFSRAALDAAAKALVAKRQAAHDAARWCVENGKGAKAAVKSGLFGDVKVVTYNVIEPLRKQLKDNGKFDVDDRDHHHQILTNVEREKLPRCLDPWLR